MLKTTHYRDIPLVWPSPYIYPPKSTSPISELPQEILSLIFGFLEELADVSKISLVCKSWNSIVWKCVKKLAICLRKKSPWNCLRKMTRIKTLELDAGNTTENVDQRHIDDILSNLTALRRLCIERCNAQLNFDSLKSLHRLESLSLYDCIRIEDLSFLLQLPRLQKLCLSKCIVSSRGFDSLSKMTALKRLFLWHTQCNDNGIRKLQALTDLETLDISGNPVLSNNCLEEFNLLKKLRLLDVSNTLITQEGLMNLKQYASKLQIGYKELYGNPLMQRSKKMKLY